MNKTNSINTTTDTLNFDDIPKIYDNIDKIKIVRGDSILNKYSDVDLIKIDTEGYEFQVLQGLSKTVKNNLPILLIEIEKRHSKNIPIE